MHTENYSTYSAYYTNYEYFADFIVCCQVLNVLMKKMKTFNQHKIPNPVTLLLTMMTMGLNPKWDVSTC
jgi:hypothetical protein